MDVVKLNTTNSNSRDSKPVAEDKPKEASTYDEPEKEEYIALYTTQKTKKVKSWVDGKLH